MDKVEEEQKELSIEEIKQLADKKRPSMPPPKTFEKKKTPRKVAPKIKLIPPPEPQPQPQPEPETETETEPEPEVQTKPELNDDKIALKYLRQDVDDLTNFIINSMMLQQDDDDDDDDDDEDEEEEPTPPPKKQTKKTQIKKTIEKPKPEPKPRMKRITKTLDLTVSDKEVDALIKNNKPTLQKNNINDVKLKAFLDGLTKKK